MRRHSVKAAAVVMGLGLLGQGRWAMAQESVKAAPLPAPLTVGADLPPLPEPVSAPAAAGTAPASFPTPAVEVDPQPVTPATQAPPPPSPSGFAIMPRSNEPPPGRPPAFRLLTATQPAETSQSRYPSVTPAPEIPVVTGAQTPVLTLDMRGPATVTLGQPLIYELAVRNVGGSAAQHVHVEDVLPAGTTFLSADPPATVQGEHLLWVLENVPPGAERHFKVAVQPSSEGEWSGNASVFMATSSSLRTRVVRGSVALTMTGPESVALGQSAVFQIHITNTSNQQLVGLVLRDRLPPSLQHPAGAEIEADLGTVEPGKTKNITLTTKAIQPGRAINSAVVTSADGQQVEARATVQVLEAARPAH